WNDDEKLSAPLRSSGGSRLGLEIDRGDGDHQQVEAKRPENAGHQNTRPENHSVHAAHRSEKRYLCLRANSPRFMGRPTSLVAMPNATRSGTDVRPLDSD